MVVIRDERYFPAAVRRPPEGRSGSGRRGKPRPLPEQPERKPEPKARSPRTPPEGVRQPRAFCPLLFSFQAG